MVAPRSLSDVGVVVFDLDGTLVDSAPDLASALAAVMSARGLEGATDVEVRAWIGDGAMALVQRAWAAREAAPPRGWDPLVDDLREAYEHRIADRTTVYPGVVAALEELRSMGVAASVCTNKPQRHTRLLLEALDLTRWFSVVVAGDTLPCRKPDPAPLRMAAAGRPAWMVGDGAADVGAACAAGVPLLVAGWGYAPPEVLADARWRCDASADLWRALSSGPLGAA
jgi:phosphoglycolate phosphatase